MLLLCKNTLEVSQTTGTQPKTSTHAPDQSKAPCAPVWGVFANSENAVCAIFFRASEGKHVYVPYRGDLSMAEFLTFAHPEMLQPSTNCVMTYAVRFTISFCFQIHSGPVQDTVNDICGGLRSACTYVGASTLKDLSKRTTFIRVRHKRPFYVIMQSPSLYLISPCISFLLSLQVTQQLNPVFATHQGNTTQ